MMMMILITITITILIFRCISPVVLLCKLGGGRYVKTTVFVSVLLG